MDNTLPRYKQPYKQKRFDNGLCISCGRERDGDTQLCSFCKERKSLRMKQLAQVRQGSGLCKVCGTPSLQVNKFCRDCWFYNVAAVTLKSSSKAQAIAQLYEDQQGRCAYIGEALILGVNTSLDHKTPKCRGGSHDIDNLQWVTKRINKNKYNLTHDEFVAECATIAARSL